MKQNGLLCFLVSPAFFATDEVENLDLSRRLGLPDGNNSGNNKRPSSNTVSIPSKYKSLSFLATF
jgi:hypothetical protein